MPFQEQNEQTKPTELTEAEHHSLQNKFKQIYEKFNKIVKTGVEINNQKFAIIDDNIIGSPMN